MEKPSGSSCKRGSVSNHTAVADKTGHGSYIFISLANHGIRHTAAHLIACKYGYIALYITLVKIFKQLCHSPHRSYIGRLGKKYHDLFAKLCGNFRGISQKSFDGRGNYTLGIKEQIIFPEIVYDEVVKVRGMDIVFVTTAETNEEALDLLKGFGLPFKK